MRRIKDIAMRMMPVVIVVAITLGLSVVIYRAMIDREIKNCWNGLEKATVDVAGEINICFDDNLKILDLTADAILLNADLNNSASVVRYLTTVRETTFFDRVDLLLPDDTLISPQNGEDKRPADRRSFYNLLAEGAHISTRTIDPYTGRESVYYFTPVVAGNEPVAMLIGAIDCKNMGDVFVSTHYGGNAQVFLVDRRNGSFLIDNWHPELGNIEDMNDRERTEEFADVDFIGEMLDGKTSEVALISKMNGKVTYMTYMPVKDFPFSVSLFIQEDTVLKNVFEMRKMLIRAGFVEMLLLLVYVLWNTYIVAVAVKNEESARAAELEKEKNEAKTVFLSSVSHDIRTPLNGIIGMLDIINLRGNVPEDIRDSLEKIDVSAKYLLTLANDVLDMNELETGKLVFADEQIDLCELIRDVGIIMEPRARERGITCNIDTQGLVTPCIIGSGVHINKILINLIINAIKYNKENGRVDIILENTAPVKGKALYSFTVRDTGIGMSDDFQKNMFAAFEQEHAGARTKQRGHGLGLSIVKRLVEKMDGKIEVESEKDVGTTFKVSIPFAVDTAGKTSESDGGNEILGLAGTNILIAEDNDLNMEIASIMLSNAGARVTQAVNGRIALDKFKASEPYTFDVILMDIMMPVMDGYEATKAIRKLERTDAKEIPIIAMTASTFSEDIKKCMDSGMTEHIGKPLDMDSMIIKIAKQLRRKQ